MIRAALLLLLLAGCAANTCPLAHNVGLECAGNTWHIEGIPNLARVRANVYRSGQPEGAAEWQLLAKLGVTDVLKLNRLDEGSDDGAAEYGIRVHYVPIPPYTTQWLSVFEEPRPTAMLEIRRLVEEMRADETFTCRPEYKGRCAPQFQRNVWLIHCVNGHDRTGLGVMLVRVLLDGWTPLQVYAEALRWGYHPQISGLDRARQRWAKPTP